MYYNTNNEVGLTLKNSESTTTNQEEAILAFFKANKGVTGFAPHTINSLVLPNSPITSVRRALTNLTDKGLLVKCDIMVRGNYGKLVHCWMLNNDNDETK